MEKNVRMGSLLDIYGELLPERQRLLIDMACNEDLSLSEISETCELTRQGVHDSIRRGELQLELYETSLHVLEKSLVRKKSLHELLLLLQQVNENTVTEAAVRQNVSKACEIVVDLLQKEE